MKLVIVTLGCLIVGAARLNAQQGQGPQDLSTLPLQQQPLPPGDLISQAPDASTWTITSTDLAPAAATSGATKPVPKASLTTITKSNHLYLVVSVTPDGRKMTRWKDHQYQATYLPDTTRPLIAYAPVTLPDGSVLYYMDFSKSDFPELSWISDRNYAGTAKLGATTLGLVFKARVPAKGTAMAVLTQPHGKQADVIAVIDAATHHPLMLQVDNELLVYQFGSGGADLSLPPEIKSDFNSFRKEIKQVSAVPPG